MRTHKFCPHCGKELTRSDNRKQGYAFQCASCGEDFFRCEVLRTRDLKKR